MLTANFAGRDRGEFERRTRAVVVERVRLSLGNYIVFSGTAESQRQARVGLIVHSLLAGIGVLLLL